jgi:hypothetical protein
VINPLCDVPRNASNEESLKGTKRKDDAGNSITSGSNIEGALRSQKGDFD